MQLIRRLAQFLSGKKSYATTLGGALYALGVTHGWWERDSQVEIAIVTLLGLAWRAALAKI